MLLKKSLQTNEQALQLSHQTHTLSHQLVKHICVAGLVDVSYRYDLVGNIKLITDSLGGARVNS